VAFLLIENQAESRAAMLIPAHIALKTR